MKKFLEYIYYKVFWFQVLVGNKDIAVFTSMLIISLILSIYMINIYMIVDILLSINDYYFMEQNIFRIIFVIIFLVILNFYTKRYKYIIKKRIYNTKKNACVILFIMGAFIIQVGLFIFMFFRNNYVI